jgi:hypothetical protein
MVDKKDSALTEKTTPLGTDMLRGLSDPAGTPASVKILISKVVAYLFTTAGDIMYATGSLAGARLGIGTAGQVLTVNSGATAPEWSTPASTGDGTVGGVNLVMNYPSLERADGAQPEWWEEEDANITLTEEDTTGETIPQKYERVLKAVNGGAGGGKYIYQRFVHADQPALDESVTPISMGVWVYSATAGTMTLEAYDVGGAASLGTDTTTTTSTWTFLKIEGVTIGTTSTDIRLKHSVNGATVYWAMPTANVGGRVIDWKPRGLRYVDKGAAAVVNSVDPAGGGYTDVDLTASTSPIAVMAVLTSFYINSTSTGDLIRVRRNGSSVDDNTLNITASYVTGVGSINTKEVLLDDQQIFEYDSTAVAGDTEALTINLTAYYEWE